MFSDEVIFTLHGKKPKMWFKDEEDIIVYEKFNPYNKAKLHFWGAISKNGKTPLYLFENTVDSEEYIKCLKKNLPIIKTLFKRTQKIIF